MLFKGKNKSNLTLKLTTAFALSIGLSCPYAFADGMFSYFDFEEVPAIKLKSPIYLDTSQTEKSVLNTSIPFNLRQFSEADYFSSSIDDLPPAKQNSPPALSLQDIPTPSEYKPVSNIVKTEQNVELPEIRANNDFFAPTPAASNFFTPIPNEEKNAETIIAINFAIFVAR